MTKICSKCKEEKGVGEFSKHKRTRDGLQCQCKACEAINWSAYSSRQRDYWSTRNPYKEKLKKQCYHCKVSLSLESFGYHIAAKDGLRSWCRKCRSRGRSYNPEIKEKERLNRFGLVYLIRESETEFYKIGKSQESSLSDRLASLQVGNPRKLIPFYSILIENPFFVEAELHRCYSQYNGNGEWFKLTPELVEEIIVYLKTQGRRKNEKNSSNHFYGMDNSWNNNQLIYT